MREIKFRAWHKNMKSMCENVNTDLLNRDYLEFMQYTGLKDTSGKEIYEGDILYYRDEGEFVGYVYWCNGCFLVSGVEEMLYEWNDVCEVAVNMYEDVERYKQL